jgi:hypothetical protein
MARTNHLKHDSRNKRNLLIIWASSLSVLIVCYVLVLIHPGKIPLRLQIPLFCIAYISAGLFFSITTSRIIHLIREQDAATILWNFSSNCADAGLQKFYASRENDAKIDLERRFNEHKKGDILLTGPSLRLFLAPGTYFYGVIYNNINRYDKYSVNIRVVNADVERNISLPIRAYVEEFNPNGEHPKGCHRKHFDWECENYDWIQSIHDIKDFNLLEFHKQFYTIYGNKAKERSRCVSDLENVAIGISELNAKTETGTLIQARKSICAPYFTAVIFPDICYYTPNMLNSKVPVNMPMLSFLGGGPVYDKILTHFKFLWWSGEDYKIMGKSSK